jgi:tetratricopeptide (TPR) repeat protein
VCVGWLWFVVMLLPVCGLVQNGLQRYADRFVYVPHIGLFMAMVWSAADASARWRMPTPALGVLTAGLLLACAAASRAQVVVWHDGVSVFERSVAMTSPNPATHVLLGLAWAERGDLARARTEYERALAIDPQHAGARGELMALEVRVYRETAQRSIAAGDTAAGIATLERAVAVAPDDAALRSDLGNALALGGRLADAIVAYRDALARDASDPHTHMNLANALYLSGQVPGALDEYAQALRLDPAYAEAHYNFGIALAEQGQPSAALEQWRDAARLGYADAARRLREAGDGR